jgi:ribonuclease T1
VRNAVVPVTGGRRTYALVVLVVLLAVVGFIALRGGDSKPATGSANTTARSISAVASPALPPAAGATTAPATSRDPGVPDRAYVTVAEIDAGRWPDSANAPGTKGGDQWMNRGGDLPGKDTAGKPITYREWDVNPKQRDHSRDAERIITGSDGSAYYTGDHYKTFTRMR